jgi:DNA processing protein
MLGVQSRGPIAPTGVAENRDREFGAQLLAIAPKFAEGVRLNTSTGTTEREAWTVLLSVPGLGPVTFSALLAVFGSAREVVSIAAAECGLERLLDQMKRGPGRGKDRNGLDAEPEQGSGLTASLARRIVEAVQSGPRTLSRLVELGLEVVTLEDSDYPSRLRLVEMPPPLLFVRGSRQSLNREHLVAVVGTRWPTDKGRLIAGWIGGALASSGASVVSGMAVGIDGAAHAAVVAEGGQTIAVLGGGHARLFPRAHERLADAIAAGGGAVVSELSPDTSPTRGTFPRRNRLVSGMSDATVVVEAGRRSGALITAGWALEQGRDCFLVPGPLDSPTSAGCLAFLRAFPGQSRVVCGVPELLEDLGLTPGLAEEAGSGTPSPEAPGAGPSATLASLSPLERTLAEELRKGPATADELARATSSSPGAILSALTLLELRGLASGAYGRYSPAGPLMRPPARCPRDRAGPPRY